MVTLGDVATIERVGLDPGDLDPSTPYLGLEHIERGGQILGRSTVGGSELASTQFSFTPDHVLFGKLRPYLAKIARPDFAGVCSTDLLPIRPGEHVDRDYLVHYLRLPSTVDQAATRAAGANLPRLNPAVLATFEIPLPPLPEQRRIAAILDHTDALRAKRRHSLTLLDLLTRSAFVDRFGDPMVNTRGLPTRALGSLASVMTGNSPSRSNPANFGGLIEWIKSDNLGGDVASDAVESLSELGLLGARVAPPGSVLVTCIAGSPASIGKASLVDRPVAFNQQINAVLPSVTIDSRFLLTQLKVAPELVRAQSTGGMKGLVSKSAFQGVQLLVPPLVDQREFASRVAEINAQRAAAQRSLHSLDELFASLQSRAFSGQL